MEAKLHALSNSSEIYEKYGELKRPYRSQRDELVPAQQRSSFVWLSERVEAEPAASSAAGSTD